MLRRGVIIASLVALGISALLLGRHHSGTHPARSSTRAPAPAAGRSAVQVRRLELARSVRGRPIGVTVLGDPARPHPVLIIGVVHGNEPAGIAIVDELFRRGPIPGQTLWLVRDLNPDGVAADTRQNAHGVDLNRNFPYGWRPTYQPGDEQYQGPKPLSEPESATAARLILRIEPRIAIWFHQPLDVTDLSGGDPAVERRFAAHAHTAVRQLTRYRGSAVGWQDHVLSGTTAFVVELPAGRLSPHAAARYADAVDAVAASAR